MPKGGRRIRIFSALEVANICGVVNQTAINWIRNGHLKAFTTPGGQYRIYAKDLAAFLDKRGMAASGEVLNLVKENANWNCFMIAMEPLAYDKLQANIGNLLSEYSIIQAFDWFEVGRKLAEDKPGFILLDTELPGGVDISRFIQTVKEDPSFGKPFVFLLTGSQRMELGVQVDMVSPKPLDIKILEAVIRDFAKYSLTATA